MAADGPWNALAVRPKSMMDYSNDLAQQDLHEQAIQQNALALKTGQLGLADRERGIQEQSTIRNALMGLGAGATDDQRVNVLRGTGLPGGFTQADALEKSMIERRKAAAISAKDEEEAKKQQIANKHTLLEHGIQSLQTAETPDQAIAHINDGVAKGFWSMADAQRKVSAIPRDPAAYHSWKVGQLREILAAKEQLPRQGQTNLGGTEQYFSQDPVTGAITINASAARTQSPDNKATNETHVKTTSMTNATSRANNRDTIAKDYAVAGLNPDGTQKTPPVDAKTGQLDITKVSPADLAAAHRYRTDGTLPPNMGRGVQGAAEALRIRNIAAALDTQAGESPEDARIRQLALKGDVNAINQIRKREIAVGANVKNFDFNADQALQLSSKVDRTGVPIVNSWLNAGRRSVSGNPELAAFDTAIKTTVNEFAQIVSGTTSGATTEGEKKKAEALLNSAQTPEQIMAVINQMKVESQNRMKSFAAQRAESMPTNRTNPSASTTPAAPSGWKYIGPVK